MRTSTELDRRLEELSDEVDRWTRQHFSRYRPDAERFAAMLGYPLGWTGERLESLDASASAGKRLRPALCLLVCEAAGGSHSAALAPAAAIELIHNFSLVHDDIQDHSPLRRGRPTVWQLWGTPQAINVGDSLFSLAQLAILGADGPHPIVADAARRFNTTALRLVEGQFLDLDLQSRGSATVEAYQTMIGGKTAALFEYAAWVGARFGGAAPDRAEQFACFGNQLGHAFRIQDDLLGVWGDPSVTGKPGDCDLRDRKQALPALLALQSEGRSAALFRQLFESPGEMDDQTAEIRRQLLEQLGIRGRVSQMVSDAFEQAETTLHAALEGRASPALESLVGRFRNRGA